MLSLLLLIFFPYHSRYFGSLLPLENSIKCPPILKMGFSGLPRRCKKKDIWKVFRVNSVGRKKPFFSRLGFYFFRISFEILYRGVAPDKNRTIPVTRPHCQYGGFCTFFSPHLLQPIRTMKNEACACAYRRRFRPRFRAHGMRISTLNGTKLCPPPDSNNRMTRVALYTHSLDSCWLLENTKSGISLSSLPFNRLKRKKITWKPMEIRNTSHGSFLFRYQSRDVCPVNNAHQPEVAESIIHRARYFMHTRCAQ